MYTLPEVPTVTLDYKVGKEIPILQMGKLTEWYKLLMLVGKEPFATAAATGRARSIQGVTANDTPTRPGK